MHVGRPFHGACVKMRGHFGVEDFRDGGDLFRLHDAAQTAQGGLQDFHAAGPQKGAKLGLGGQTLTRGQGDADLPRDLGEFQQVVWRDRLFVPQRIVGLQLAAHADGAGGGELAVGAEEKVGPVAHRLADFAAELDRAGDVGHRRFMPTADGIGAGGVKLDRRKAHVHIARGGLCRHVGVDPEL